MQESTNEIILILSYVEYSLLNKRTKDIESITNKKNTNNYMPSAIFSGTAISIRLMHESAISRGCLVVVPILGSGM